MTLEHSFQNLWKPCLQMFLLIKPWTDVTSILLECQNGLFSSEKVVNFSHPKTGLYGILATGKHLLFHVQGEDVIIDYFSMDEHVRDPLFFFKKTAGNTFLHYEIFHRTEKMVPYMGDVDQLCYPWHTFSAAFTYTELIEKTLFWLQHAYTCTRMNDNRWLSYLCEGDSLKMLLHVDMLLGKVYVTSSLSEEKTLECLHKGTMNKQDLRELSHELCENFTFFSS